MRWLIGLLIACAIMVGGLVYLFDSVSLTSKECRAVVGDHEVSLDMEQAAWAALIAARGHARELSPRATTIAIATAYQESKIRNIDYGDRDSVGLFQQRPSQGWGSVEQILDPKYSIDRFYEGLEKVSDFENRPITEAAQAVQRSAHPEAYAQHEANSRALASALRGHSPAALTCTYDADDAPRATTSVEELLNESFGRVAVTSTGDNQTISLSDDDGTAAVRGWMLAQFLVANAYGHSITSVSFDGRTWRAAEDSSRWQADPKASSAAVTFTTG